METKKTFLTLFLIPYSLFLCHAQTDTGKKQICDAYMKEFNYKYVFEGKIISSKEITIKTGEDTYDNYTSYLIEVRKVLKGNLQKGTIEMVQVAPGGHYKTSNGLIVTYMPADGPGGPPSQGIYFSNEGVGVKDSSVAHTNAISLWFYDGIAVSDGKLNKDPRRLGLSLYFSTLAEFYDYIRANYGVKIDSVK